jgi:hypothetical protein
MSADKNSGPARPQKGWQTFKLMAGRAFLAVFNLELGRKGKKKQGLFGTFVPAAPGA